MFCLKCGAKIVEDSLFCSQCGEKAAHPSQTTRRETPAEKASRQHNPQKAIIILSVFGGVFLLSLMTVAVITFFALCLNTPGINGNKTSAALDINALGNTPANIMCDGIAATLGNTIYYMQASGYENENFLMAMDPNGNNEQILFTCYGEISDLNVVGNQIFFVGDTYDENYNIVESDIYVYNLATATATTIYTTDREVLGLYVAADRLYFRITDAENADQLCSANLDGSNVLVSVEQDDYLYSFGVFDSFLYYDYLDTLYRCDLSGQNATKIFSSANTLGTYCIENDHLFIVDCPKTNCPVLQKLDLNGDQATDIASFGEDEWIVYLNVVDNTIYYVEETLNQDSEVILGKICSMNSDGSNQQTLVVTDSDIYGLAICGHWIFYYDNDKGKTVKLNLNNVSQNTI